MKKKFTSTLVNVTFDFIMTDSGSVALGHYDPATKEIIINLKPSIKYLNENCYSVIEYITETIVHELTHFFDYNFFKSWQYKQKDISEHMATFSDCFYSYIEDIKNQVITFLKDEKIIADKNVIVSEGK